MAGSRPRHLVFESALATAVGKVWAVVGTMDGVNAELGPWFRMTTPAGLESMRIEDAPLDRELFASWVLFAGLPVDRHFFRLMQVEPEKGFLEQSTSWTERRWQHERTLVPTSASSCTVVDRLELTPRLRLMAPLLVRVVGAVFRHRHRRLRERFGVAWNVGERA